MKKLLTVKQAADMMQVKTATVYDWLRDGKLKGFRLAGYTWRTTEEDVEDFIKSWRK